MSEIFDIDNLARQRMATRYLKDVYSGLVRQVCGEHPWQATSAAMRGQHTPSTPPSPPACPRMGV